MITVLTGSINTGQSFRTTNGVFLWEMGKQFNVTMAEVGNNSTLVNFNGTGQQYADNKLEHCDVSGGESRMRRQGGSDVVTVF